MEAQQGEQSDDNQPFFTPQRDFNDLLKGDHWEEYLTYGIPMYQAALKGDWEVASQLINEYPVCKIAKITKQRDTALHVAVTAKQTYFVRNLVAYMDEKELALQNDVGNTALCLAAATGNVPIANILVEKNYRLPMIRGSSKWTPLYMAALLGYGEMVKFLWPLTKECLTHDELIRLLSCTINMDLYDVAMDVLKLKLQDVAPRILTRYEKVQDPHYEPYESPMHILARKSMKSSRRHMSFWRRFCTIFNKYSRGGDINTQKTSALELLGCLWKGLLSQGSEAKISNLLKAPPRLLFIAVKAGNVEFLTTVIRSYPDLIWAADEKGRSIFHVAVLYRQESIFQLIYKVDGIKELLTWYLDKKDNNMLHLAAMLPPSPDTLNRISGAALQMMRELQWFKMVEDLVKPAAAEALNGEGKTARELFTENHKELRKAGEKWMRNTASSCSVVATLIASVVSGAALKIPGGDNGHSADPLNHGAKYRVFAICDWVSLISAIASIFMFLSILTSRYAEEDFLRSLPLKLMIGLTSLLISIATMLIAFTATFSIVFKHERLWAGTSIIAFAPILFFGIQILPLLADVCRSTIRCNFVFKRHHKLF